MPGLQAGPLAVSCLYKEFRQVQFFHLCMISCPCKNFPYRSPLPLANEIAGAGAWISLTGFSARYNLLINSYAVACVSWPSLARSSNSLELATIGPACFLFKLWVIGRSSQQNKLYLVHWSYTTALHWAKLIIGPPSPIVVVPTLSGCSGGRSFETLFSPFQHRLEGTTVGVTMSTLCDFLIIMGSF